MGEWALRIVQNYIFRERGMGEVREMLGFTCARGLIAS